MIGKHICTNINDTKNHQSFLVNYLKLTLQELIKNCKEKNIANFLKGSIKQHEKKKEEKPSEKSSNTAPLHMEQSLLDGRA